MPSRVRQSLFHAQQAAEKSLKAFLIWHEQPFPLTHDLARLLRLCVSIDSGIATGVEPALDLTQFAARFRYPGEDDVPSIEEAQLWVAAAAGVLDCVRIRIAGNGASG
jgi:HEPN domain-containing protein